MPRSNGTVEENAEFRIDREKYENNFVHIFQKDKCPCEECTNKRKEQDETPEPSRS